ncbi:MAG TPA: beta-ketoacyl-ACP synthase II [Thermomicrobiales bacterium]|nr:beta-ketoacyl-ACP synthase II [Thermomicrobiales bacterium]
MARRSEQRVVVTGIGIVSPLGPTRDTTWEAVRAGCSGVAPLTRIDVAGLATTFGGEVKAFDPAAILGRKEARRVDRYTQFAVAAALEALAHAELKIEAETADRVGVLAGTGMGGIETIEQGAATLFDAGPSRISPFFVPMFLPNMASGAIAITTGAKGPNFSPTSACAASAHAIGEAAEMIRRGWADVMLAGGAEAPLARLSVAGFNAMGALSTRNDDPAAASRPFDAERDGFVMAEGGAMLVLESLPHALGRNAPILGELSGYATTDDANHVVQPAPGGVGAANAMRLALESAGMAPEQIGYINAHGTSTQLNETLETQAIKRAFGEAAWTTPISSTKSMTGHLLGAAGALEAGIALLAMRDSFLPPTINQQVADPECDLDYIPNQGREVRVDHVMSNSMGFGGHNVSLIFSRFVG